MRCEALDFIPVKLSLARVFKASLWLRALIGLGWSLIFALLRTSLSPQPNQSPPELLLAKNCKTLQARNKVKLNRIINY